MERKRGTKGHKHEFYELQVPDWMTIKSELKELCRKMMALDMNVIVTARQKVQYADTGFMRPVGETFDGEKTLPYLFDTIVRLWKTPDGNYRGQCLKDRTRHLPDAEFRAHYSVFAETFGDGLNREVKEVAYASPETIERIVSLAAELKLPAEKVRMRLEAYGAESFDELHVEDAATILTKLEAAAAAASNNKQKESIE
jgi:hypothetical protein